jgi:hypothetical protein
MREEIKAINYLARRGDESKQLHKTAMMKRDMKLPIKNENDLDLIQKY